MDQALVQALRARNVDVVTASDLGMIEQADSVHLDCATEQGRVLCSFNIQDYYRLHSDYSAQGKPHAGIILMRQQHYTVGEQMRRLLRLVAAKSPDEMKDWAEFLSAWS